MMERQEEYHEGGRNDRQKQSTWLETERELVS
jgi:hypothetical protein